jgi:hypothetical protein
MNPYKMLKQSVPGRIVRGSIAMLSSPNAVRWMTPRILKTFLLLNVIFLFASQRASAQQYSLVGTWYGYYDGISEEMVLAADGQFSAYEAAFDYYILMTGNWAQMPGQDVIKFTVTNYEPKSDPAPSDISGGTFQFTSANTFIYHSFSGPTLQYTRVQ